MFIQWGRGLGLRGHARCHRYSTGSKGCGFLWERTCPRKGPNGFYSARGLRSCQATGPRG
ncbi:hypothetical protein PRJ_0320 [Pseudomonas sp. XWY-1]|nr:hypothetical protein PRJ_0320 [Pseudomonas sp. XWY-1]